MKIIRTVDTDAPVEKVFAYLSDFTSTNDWDPGTVRTELTQGDGGVGTTYHNTSSFMGRETELVYTVTALDEHRRFQLVGENSTVRATDTMTFARTGRGTQLTYTADFQFQGLLGKVAPLLTPVLALAFKKLGDEAEEGLQTHLDKL